MFQPVIKWSGSKRSQSSDIVSYFPNEINTYYEPFCGGCSVLRTLIESGRKVNRYICSDVNGDLIDLWNRIIEEPENVADVYETLWYNMNYYREGSEKPQYAKKAFYEVLRREFNDKRDPDLFFFLNRTCFNGLIRYNSKGEFNSPYHLNRNGIKPDKMRKIIYEWSDLLRANCVEFIKCEYNELRPENGDFVYCDPPYANTQGMYNGSFYNDDLFVWLSELPCAYALSYDGVSGNENHTYSVPSDLYNEHYYIKSGNSSFKRLKQSDNKAIVYESLYLRTINHDRT